MALTWVSSGHSQQEPASPGDLSLLIFGWIRLRHLLRHLGTVCVSWDCHSLGAVTDIVFTFLGKLEAHSQGLRAWQFWRLVHGQGLRHLVSGEASLLVLSLSGGVFSWPGERELLVSLPVGMIIPF